MSAYNSDGTRLTADSIDTEPVTEIDTDPMVTVNEDVYVGFAYPGAVTRDKELGRQLKFKSGTQARQSEIDALFADNDDEDDGDEDDGDVDGDAKRSKSKSKGKA